MPVSCFGFEKRAARPCCNWEPMHLAQSWIGGIHRPCHSLSSRKLRSALKKLDWCGKFWRKTCFFLVKSYPQNMGFEILMFHFNNHGSVFLSKVGPDEFPEKMLEIGRCTAIWSIFFALVATIESQSIPTTGCGMSVKNRVPGCPRTSKYLQLAEPDVHGRMALTSTHVQQDTPILSPLKFRGRGCTPLL